jgi:hypothetical protein
MDYKENDIVLIHINDDTTIGKLSRNPIELNSKMIEYGFKWVMGKNGNLYTYCTLFLHPSTPTELIERDEAIYKAHQIDIIMAQFGVTIIKHNAEDNYFKIEMKNMSTDESTRIVIWEKGLREDLYNTLLSIYIASEQSENIEIPTSMLIITGTIMTL